MSKKLLTVNEAADMIGVNRQTIINYVNKGLFKRAGNSAKTNIYLYADEVEAVIGEAREIEEIKERINSLKSVLEDQEHRLKMKLSSLHLKNKSYGFIIGETKNFIRKFAEAVLTEREATVVSMMFSGSDLDEISRKIGLSVSQTRIVINKIRSRMRYMAGYVVDLQTKYNELNTRVSRLMKELEIQQSPVIDMQKDEVCHKEVYVPEGVKQMDEHMSKVLDIHINNIKSLSVRAINVLKRVNCDTVYDITRLYREDLLKMWNCGIRTVREIEDLLESVNLDFGMDIRIINGKYYKFR